MGADYSRVAHPLQSFHQVGQTGLHVQPGNVSARREFLQPFDWRSGDWFSPNNHRLHMSVTARRYATTGLPYDAYTCDTAFVHAWKHMRSRSKPLDRMLQEGATLLANGATWGYWTYPMPHGAFVPSKMRVAAEAAKFASARGLSAHGVRAGYGRDQYGPRRDDFK